jgi:phage baseplate assembly protein W
MLKKFKGCPYPITTHPLGYLHTQWGVDQIKSDLLILLMTNPGERIMLPQYGTNLNKFLFEPNDELLRQEVKNEIITAIKNWEPRVTITNIEIFSGTGGLTKPVYETGITVNESSPEFLNNEEHVLGIKINFIDPENISEIQELVLEVPLSS